MIYTCYNFFRKLPLKRAVSSRFSNVSFRSWSIVFFGSDHYSLYSLKALNEQMKQINISQMEVVVTNENSVVYKYSVSNGIKTHIWPPNLSGPYDFGVIVSFGKLIPASIIQQFHLGIINVHGSLLPKYRGGMPMVHAIKNGEAVTGVTVTKIKVDKFDVGEIILQKSCSIGENELMPSLYKRLMELGCECLLEVISKMPQCLDNCIPQSAEGASYAPKLTKEVALVKWSEMTATEIFNLFRALFGIFELTSTWNAKPVKFICMFLSDSTTHQEGTEQEPGSFTYNKKTKFLYVQCKDRPITVCTLKYSKKVHSASSFHAGYLHKISDTSWKFRS